MSTQADERFFELALKLIRSECTEAEHRELGRILDSDPKRNDELARLRSEYRVAKELTILIEASEAVGEKPSQAKTDEFLKEVDAHFARKRSEAGRKVPPDSVNQSEPKSVLYLPSNSDSKQGLQKQLGIFLLAFVVLEAATIFLIVRIQTYRDEHWYTIKRLVKPTMHWDAAAPWLVVGTLLAAVVAFLVSRKKWR